MTKAAGKIQVRAAPGRCGALDASVRARPEGAAPARQRRGEEGRSRHQELPRTRNLDTGPSGAADSSPGEREEAAGGATMDMDTTHGYNQSPRRELLSGEPRMHACLEARVA